MRNRWITLLAATALTGCAWAAEAPATATAPADLARQIAAIRGQLGSADYAEREAGQKLLEQVPVAQLEPLRALAETEADAEVKARLLARVEEMEVYRLIHPPGLTVNLQNATRADLVAQLNQQLGSTMIETAAGTVAGEKGITVAAQNQPFWTILAQAGRQQPLSFGFVTTINGTALRLLPATRRVEFRMYETFALAAQVAGQPETEPWEIVVAGLSDPRVRVARYSALKVDKLTDQDGRSLLSAVERQGSASTVIRPTANWTGQVTLLPSRGLRQIRDFHATMIISVVEKEGNASLDLTKPSDSVDCALGHLTVETTTNGQLILHTEAPPAAPGALRALRPSLRLYDAAGKLQSTAWFSSLPALRPINPGARLEITWIDKTRDVVIPVDWPGLEVPPVVPLVPNAAR